MQSQLAPSLYRASFSLESQIFQDVFSHETRTHTVELNGSEQRLKSQFLLMLAASSQWSNVWFKLMNSWHICKRMIWGTSSLLMLLDIFHLFDIRYILRPLEVKEGQSENINGTLGSTTHTIFYKLVFYHFFLPLTNLPVSSQGVAVCLKASTSSHQNS